jgi:hypothetical protein
VSNQFALRPPTSATSILRPSSHGDIEMSKAVREAAKAVGITLHGGA